MDEIELQFRIIYAIIVAGKSAKFAEGAIKKLFPCRKEVNPFNIIRKWIDEQRLDIELRKAKTGNYTKIAKALQQLVFSNINLETCQPADLEKIHGIGPKTARFFIIWTRPDAYCAALDVHVLRWLHNQGYDVPKSTPPAGKTYEKIEKIFLNEASQRGLTPRQLDEYIWVNGSGYGSYNPTF